MAEFAPVCPAEVLEELCRKNVDGPYHLPLAHDVLASPEIYERLFNPHEYFRHTTILDNSVIELGAAVDIKTIAEAAKITQAHVIVLPDVLLKGPETLTACIEALDHWTQYLEKTLQHDWGFMFVPQGATVEEFLYCAEAFASYCREKPTRMRYWGVPRNSRDSLSLSRYTVSQLLHKIEPNWKQHLLGFSEDFSDDIFALTSPCVTGIDSAVPVRCATFNMRIQDLHIEKLPPRGDWWEKPQHEEYIDQMAANVVRMRELCRN